LPLPLSARRFSSHPLVLFPCPSLSRRRPSRLTPWAGTNVELGKQILNSSGIKLTTADDLDDAAKKAVATLA
jgi:hypothetical protein